MTAAQFRYLANLDMDATEQQQVSAIADFADLWIKGYARNQPIRMDGDTLKLELGYASFEEATGVWKKLKQL